MTGKPITDLLREMENGQLVEDLTRELHRIVKAVRDTRKPGKLKLSLDIKPTGAKSMAIDAKFDSSIPEHDRPGSTFFVTRDDQLVCDDEEQPRLPLREVETNKAPLREVAG